MTPQLHTPRPRTGRVGDDVTALPAPVLRDRVTHGGCAGQDTEAWFPPEPDAKWPQGRANYEATARTLCSGCPVTAECLELALRDEARPRVTPHGIFGGRAPWERQAMIRNRRRRAHAAHRRQTEGVSA